jgi:hypothetical protein
MFSNFLQDITNDVLTYILMDLQNKSKRCTIPLAPPFRSVLLLFQTTRKQENSQGTLFCSLMRCQSGFQSVSDPTTYKVWGVAGPQSGPLSHSF